MRNQMTKKLLCLLLALILTFSSTLALYTEDVGRVVDEADYAEAYPLDEYPPEEDEFVEEEDEFVEEREDEIAAEATDGRVPGITIVRAQVLVGGQHQVLWRNADQWDVGLYTVYRGNCAIHGDADHDPDNFYTTARMVNLHDSRRFTLEIVVPLGDFTGIGTAEGQFNPAAVTITYTSGPGNGTQTLAPAQTVIHGARVEGDFIIIDAAVSTVGVNLQQATGMNRPFAPAYDGGNPNAALWNRIGYWPLRVNYTGLGTIAEKQLRTSVNDSIIRWEEFDAWAKDFVEEFGENGTTEYGTTGRFVQVESYGTSHGGRDLWAVVISDAAESVDDYLTRTVPLMNSDPAAMQQQLLDGTFDHRGVIMLSANHGNETQANGILPDLIHRLTHFDEIRFPFRTSEGTHWHPEGATGGTSGTRIHHHIDGPNTQPANSLFRGGIVDEILCVDELLENYIIVIQFWTNPDGNAVPQRANRFGSDPNRDGGQFNFAETQYSIDYQNKWDPIYFMELHAQVRSFQNDGCTPPIEASLEADLIDDFMVCLLEAMGYAALGVSFNHYRIPMRDRFSGWDSAALIYSASKAMMNGALGSTLEYPMHNQEAMDSGLAGFFGTFQFMIENRDFRQGCRPTCIIPVDLMPQHVLDNNLPPVNCGEICENNEHPGLFWNKLEFKRRGVENVDAAAYIDPLSASVDWRFEFRRHLPVGHELRLPGTQPPVRHAMLRPRPVVNGEQLSFFPDYWVVPMDRSLQYSPSNAAAALQLLERIGHVEIDRTTAPVVGADGYVYPSGTYVIRMNQGRRSFAHGAFYRGFDTSVFGGLYDSQTVVSWPAQRGFNAIDLWEAGLFDGVTEPVSMTYQALPAGDSDFVIYKNTGTDAIRLTNRLLNDDRGVWMTISYIPGAELGDFIARRADVEYMVGPHVNEIWGPTALNVFALDFGDAAPAAAVATPLVQPTLAIARPPASGTGSLVRFMLDTLEFTQYQAGATGPGAVWVGSGAPPAAAANIPAFMWSASNANVNTALGANAVASGNVTGLVEMIGRGGWSGSSIVAPGYDAKDFLIAIGGTAYINPRDDIKVLGQFVHVPGTGNNPERGSQIYLGGRRGLNNAAAYSDRILAVTGIRANGTGVTAVSQDITTRGRLQAMWHLLGSSVFAYAAGITDAPRPVAQLDASFTPVAAPATIRRNQTVNLGAGTINLIALAQDTAGIAPGVTVETFKFVVNTNPVQPAYDGSTAWQEVPANGNIPLPSGAVYIHWFIENSEGVTNQGTFRPGCIGFHAGITWTSSNPTLATVSQAGVVQARAASGIVVITARINGQVVSTTTLRLSA